MVNRIRFACEPKIIVVLLSQILPVKKLSPGINKTAKYRRIAASVREVGIVEPLVVYPQKNGASQYILLDGHIRLEILKEIGQEKVKCLVALDNEGFTYNHKVNPLSAIQEHFMIMEAIRHGVSEERIAKTLDVDVAAIRRKRDLLEGICPEAVQLLKEKRASNGAFREMRKVRPMRQIEMAELMVASNNFSAHYAQCLFAATPTEQLLEPDKPKEIRGQPRGHRPDRAGNGEPEPGLSSDRGFPWPERAESRARRGLPQATPRQCPGGPLPIPALREILTEFQKIIETKGLGAGE